MTISKKKITYCCLCGEKEIITRYELDLYDESTGKNIIKEDNRCINIYCKLEEFTLTKEREICGKRPKKCWYCKLMGYSKTGHKHGLFHKKCLDCGYRISLIID